MPTTSSSVTELPESRVRVEAQVPPEEVERSLAQAARELGRTLRVPGFRKGKVPPQVVIRRVGREAVLDEALRTSLGRWYADAIHAARISPVGEPQFDFGDLPGAGEPLTFTIEIGVRPKAKLGEYKGLEVGRREASVDPAAVDAELERMRERLASLETVERPAATGDHLVMDYVGSIDGVPFPGGEGRDQLLELGSGRLIPGFEEQLVGASAGEERAVEVTFPDDYVEHLAGKQAQFAVTVSEVKEKRLPELNDEFAEESGGFDTLAELREDIEQRMRTADERQIENEFEQAVLESVIAGAEIELPGQLIHARAHELLEQTMSGLARQGISKEAYLQITGSDEETLAHQAEPEAAATLRREAILAAVVGAEQITPTDEEMIEALTPAAERAGEDPATVFARLRDADGIDRLREDVATSQALALLVSEAKTLTVEEAKAKQKLYTPGREEAAQRSAEELMASGSAGE